MDNEKLTTEKLSELLNTKLEENKNIIKAHKQSIGINALSLIVYIIAIVLTLKWFDWQVLLIFILFLFANNLQLQGTVIHKLQLTVLKLTQVLKRIINE